MKNISALFLCFFLSQTFLLTGQIGHENPPDPGCSYLENVLPLCEEHSAITPDIIINTANSDQYGAGFSNQVIFIQNQLTINTGTFFIQNCTIKFSPGASIKIRPGKYLE
ncbi:MAG: hypothetical protein DHS20C18_51570 [Saprospiraceae bacterium]|nr:MAG: hypothetical protein DHS20C18_51570 [Saprospiraceae bacterium]